MAQLEHAEAGGVPSAVGTAGTRQKVVYVMGAGRSGSTILGVALGNCVNFFYAGELDKWLLMSGVSMHERAGAKPGSGDVDLWRQVRDDVAVPPGLFGRGVRSCIEHSTALLRVHRRRERRRLLAPYRGVTEQLYRAVARRTGASYVVDSSHLPLRALQLQSLPGIELHLLFLVRDPRDVVASWERPGLPEPRFSMLATNVYLWLTHLLAVFVFLRQPRERRLFVRYEDLVADPERVLRGVLGSTGSDAPLPDLGALRTGTPYHGNRLIHAEQVSLARDGGGPRRRRSRLTALLQLPWGVVLARLRPVAARSGFTRT